MRFREAFDLLFSWAFLSFVFGIAVTHGAWLRTPFAPEVFGRLKDPMLLSFGTLGLGFAVHELSHRAVARSFGARAEFRASYLGLALSAILTTLTGLMFVLPGAVVIPSPVSRREAALIAAAGPASNVALVAVFLSLILHFPTVAGLGVAVNSLLAFFNSLPIRGLDGRKVYEGSRLLWAMLFGISALAAHCAMEVV